MTDKHQRLRHARQAAGYNTASDAANRLGVVYATYAGHENGSRGYGEAEAQQYAKAFRTRPEWLLFGTKDAPQGAIAAELTPLEWELIELFRRIPEGRRSNAVVAIGLGVPDNEASSPEAPPAASGSSGEPRK